MDGVAFRGGVGLVHLRGAAAEAASERLPVVTLALGLAVAEAILDATGIPCDLRWPNDVMVDGEEVRRHSGAAAGRCRHRGHRNQREPDCVSGGIAGAGDIAADCVRAGAIAEYSARELAALDRFAFSRVLQRARKGRDFANVSQVSSYVRGRRVVVDQGNAMVEGTTEGLNASGFLILRKDDGQRTLILAGGVRPAQ